MPWKDVIDYAEPLFADSPDPYIAIISPWYQPLASQITYQSRHFATVCILYLVDLFTIDWVEEPDAIVTPPTYNRSAILSEE